MALKTETKVGNHVITQFPSNDKKIVTTYFVRSVSKRRKNTFWKIKILHAHVSSEKVVIKEEEQRQLPDCYIRKRRKTRLRLRLENASQTNLNSQKKVFS